MLTVLLRPSAVVQIPRTNGDRPQLTTDHRTMTQVSADLSDELNQWIESEVDRRNDDRPDYMPDATKSEIIREALTSLRESREETEASA